MTYSPWISLGFFNYSRVIHSLLAHFATPLRFLVGTWHFRYSTARRGGCRYSRSQTVPRNTKRHHLARRVRGCIQVLLRTPFRSLLFSSFYISLSFSPSLSWHEYFICTADLSERIGRIPLLVLISLLPEIRANVV